MRSQRRTAAPHCALTCDRPAKKSTGVRYMSRASRSSTSRHVDSTSAVLRRAVCSTSDCSSWL